MDRLAPLAPDFVSITYGAGGRTRQRTHEMVVAVKQRTLIEPAAHLTCVGASREEIRDILERYWEAGIRHLVALRGDPPSGSGAFVPPPGGYAGAVDLVSDIRAFADFEISVAAHPEGHPDSTSLKADLEHLKRKEAAGASRAITQYFFDPEVFLRFRDQAIRAGIRMPLVPGILPVTDFGQLQRISARCGARVPLWLEQLFAGLDQEPETGRLVGAHVTAGLCQDLLHEGVEAFHFYTLNRAELTRAVCRFLGVSERPLRPGHLPAAALHD